MRVICTLPNAAQVISGVVFGPAHDQQGWISEELTDEQAARFLRIPGYSVVEAEPEPSEPEPSSRRARAKSES